MSNENNTDADFVVVVILTEQKSDKKGDKKGEKKLVHQFTVVPQKFVLGLKSKDVKNMGKNAVQRRRIYFSKEWFENQEKRINLGKQFIPNFNLPVSNIYPLPNNVVEAVFYGYTNHYDGKCKIYYTSI